MPFILSIQSFLSLYFPRPAERSGEDVDIILARLKNVKAFERFHPGLLQQICLCGFYECLEKGITCRSRHTRSKASQVVQLKVKGSFSLCVPVYRQGDIGTSWYAVLSGSLDVKVSETSSYHVRYHKCQMTLWFHQEVLSSIFISELTSICMLN